MKDKGGEKKKRSKTSLEDFELKKKVKEDQAVSNTIVLELFFKPTAEISAVFGRRRRACTRPRA